MRKRDNRTPEKRAADCRAWYLINKENVKRKCAEYKRRLRADPVAWAGYLAKVRAYRHSQSEAMS